MNASERNTSGNGIATVGLSPELTAWLECQLQTKMHCFQEMPSAADLIQAAVRLLVVDMAAMTGGSEALAEVRACLTPAELTIVALLPGNAERTMHRRLVHELGVEQLFMHPVERGELLRYIASALNLSIVVSPVKDREVEAGIDAALAALWQKFRPANMARLRAIEDAANQYQSKNLTPEARLKAEREAHKLAGAAGSFGFHEASRIARRLEMLLQTLDKWCPEQAGALSQDVAALRDSLERPPVPIASINPKRPFVLAIDNDSVFTEALATDCSTRGFDLGVAGTVRDALDVLDRRRPEAVLFNPGISGNNAKDAAQIITELTSRDIPAIICTEQDNLEDRVRATRWGAQGFLRKPVAAADAMQSVQQLLQKQKKEEYTVLSVDDDPQTLAALEELLRPHGIRLVAVADPLAFWDALEANSPDLVILDENMPHLSGIELCRVVRGEQRWSELPVLFLTRQTDRPTVQRIFDAGADDYVAKPIIGPELVTRVLNRLERTRMQRNMSERDPLTGIGNRRKFTNVMEHYLRLAGRNQQPVSVAILDMDGLKQLNDVHGHALGDMALRRFGERLLKTFRGEDVVARWGGDEFVIGMYGMRREAGAKRLRKLLDDLRAETFETPGGIAKLSFSGGVAQYPEDGTTLHSLYLVADSALYAAKSAGKNQVVCADSKAAKPAEQTEVDVVIVEDDEVMASALLAKLKLQGFKTYWLNDGDAAANALSGARPPVRAKIALLDIDLPGQNGYSILDRMVRDGVCAKTRVIVLAARSSEQDITKSIESGAYDHVVKPCHFPLLMRRIKNAMEA